MTFDLRDVDFENDRIIIKDKNSNFQIIVSDIWTMFYAKWSLKNYFALAYTRSISMGYLYIATKDMKKMTDVIRIRIPSGKIKNIPPKIHKKIQFYETTDFPDILRLK